MPPPAPGHAAHRADRGPPQPGVGQDGPRDDGCVPAQPTRPPRPGPTGARMPAHPSRRRSRRAAAHAAPTHAAPPTHAGTAPHKPTRAAPISGPRSPRPPGTTSAPRANSSRHNSSISAWAAPKNGLAETQRDRSADDGERQVEQVHHRRDGPTHQRPRALHHCRRGEPGRPSRDGRQRRPGRLRLEAATAAALAPPPVGNDDDVTDVARVAEPSREQPPVEHDAAADARRHHHGDVVPPTRRRRRPSPHPTRAPWRRCRRRWAARSARAAGSAGERTATPGCSTATPLRHPGSSARRSPPRRRRRGPRRAPPRRRPAPIRPGHPTGPQPLRRPGPGLAPLGSAGLGAARVGRIARSTREPSRVTNPAAILVPPMSTASARSATDRLPRPRSRQGCQRYVAAQRGRVQPRAVLSPRAGGSGSGTSRGPRSPRPRSRSMRRSASTPRPSSGSGRANRPGPCAAGSVRTRPRRRT